MEKGLLYLLFMLFVVLLVSAKQTNSEQKQKELPSSHVIVKNDHSVCVVPEFKFSLKKIVASDAFKFMFQKTSNNINAEKYGTAVDNMKAYLVQTIGIRHFKKKKLLIKEFTATNNEDYHHVS